MYSLSRKWKDPRNHVEIIRVTTADLIGQMAFIQRRVWDSPAKQWDGATQSLGVWTPPIRFTENLCDNFSGYWRQSCCHGRPVVYSTEPKYGPTAPRWDGIYLAGFWTCSEPIILSFFHVSLFRNGNASLCHHCNLEVHWLICSQIQW